MFEQLTEEEIIALGGSPRMFWHQKAQMLTGTTAFHGAARFAQEKYEACVSALRNAKISIIMPFYNRLDLMPKTIESVLNQTYTNWELILANDGTIEDISIIEEIANQDKRIKLINLPHRGASAARNSAISASTGEFVALLDSDDFWVSEKLKKQLNYMLDNGFAFSHTSFEQRFLNGDLLASYDVSQFRGDVFFLSIYTWSICTCCVMFERLTLGNARFPEHIRMGEDICLWFHFLWRYEVGAVSDVLTIVRVQKGSASQSIAKRREALHSVIGFLQQNYNYDECMPYIGSLVHGFASLFPAMPTYNTVNLNVDEAIEPTIAEAVKLTIAETVKPTIDIVVRPINPRNYPLRFLLGLKRHGFKGFWKIFWQRLKLKIKRTIYREERSFNR
jgi:glycosyltransferase involved in cell wall biosynthesis